MLSFLIVRPFPNWCWIGALPLNWFNWQRYQHANAVPILDNALPIPCQLRTKIQLTEKNQFKTIDFQSLPSEGQCSANPVGIKNLQNGCQFTSNWIPIYCQSDGHPTGCQLRSNWMPIEIQLDANWDPIGCQLRADPMSYDFQWKTNWLSIRCQLRSNWVPIDIQSDANGDPIEYQLRSNWKPVEIK